MNSVQPNSGFVKVARITTILVIISMILSPFGVNPAKAAPITFTGTELLGRPTDNSISISIVPDTSILRYYQYGTTSGGPYSNTSTGIALAGQPNVVTISSLMPNTKYYYRMQYSTDLGLTWTIRPEYSFWTQRAVGNTFTFTISSDSHVNIILGSAAEWTKTLNNIAADHPDFEIDLGDTFMMDGVTTVATAETNYKYQLPFFNKISASASIFLVPGNHEQQEGWHLDDTADPSLAPPIIGTNAQKKYFLNPVPDSFYSGDTNTYSTLGGDQLRQDYYSWTWGDALFVVIDPFWFTTTKPFTGNTGGGETSDTGSGNRWDWSLGVEQYNWLKNTLAGSTAKYKFILTHHMTGGSDDYVRGGANPANLVEWGGYNEAGTVYEWDSKRPAASGWGSQPIHEMMVANGVSAFFHGHDHQFAYEKRDGIVYQSLPAAGFTGNGFNIYTTGSGNTIQALPSDGHLRVTVGSSQTTVDYVQSTGATVAYSYNIAPAGPKYNLTTAVNPVSAGTTDPSIGVHAYSQNTVVPVTTTAAAGYTFSSWSGACAGSGACSVTMDADKSVTANFITVPTHDLTVAVSPPGAGTTNPAVGSHTYNENFVVPVTAAPASGYVFDSWSGDCTGSGSCSVTMSTAKSVTANFTSAPISFTGSELLGRPTDTSIAISIVPDAAISLYYQYGTIKGGPYTDTVTETASAGQPKVMSINGLSTNTQYYYRMQYSADGGSTWNSRSENSFWTQRSAGSTFKFTITSDSHVNIMLGNATTWQNTLNDIKTDSADFEIDLGDTFAMDTGTTIIATGDIAAAEQVYKYQLPFFNTISASVPIFIVAGNHEEQEAWHLNPTNPPVPVQANTLPIMGKNAEKKYYLNPVPDSFYSGNASTNANLSGDHLKQDYYAWTWGDALFVVISPFWTTTTKPYTTTVGGGETDSTGSGDRWDWTLGVDQYNWLKNTLEHSNAKYKFIFAHQIVGGNSLSSPDQVNYGHGGVDSANLVEWGGFDVGTTNNTWATHRLASGGWGSLPIHQLMVAYGVTAFFHGHDHQYAQEELDGIVYQAVPSGSFTGGFGIYTTGGNSGKTIQADSTQGPGHLLVTVGPSQTTVDFFRSSAASPVYSYYMDPTYKPYKIFLPLINR